MKKYGLQLRIPHQNRQPMGPPAARAPVFGHNDDDDDDVNRDISRQATKKKALKDVEEQHKKALEDDPTVFDYDGVYDKMKEAAVRPLVQDRKQRESKYIGRLMEKAKQREREHEIIYERKLAKERSKDEHLYQDKDKYITSAYKKKLAEQEKWMQEERRRELREEKEDVTKKSDILDFYFNLSKNVAYGAKAAESSRQVEQDEIINADASGKEVVVPKANSPSNSAKANVTEQGENSPHSKENNDSLDVKSEVKASVQDNTVAEQPPAEQKRQDPQKRKEDEVAAAKARFLARKKAKEN